MTKMRIALTLAMAMAGLAGAEDIANGSFEFDKVSVVDITEDVAMTRTMEEELKELDRPIVYAAHTNTPPVLDGDLNDPCWQGRFKYADFKLMNGNPPKEQTEFMICHDGQFLYVAVKAYALALNPVNNLLSSFRDAAKKRKGPVYSDDGIEFFFSHDKMAGYYQIIGNVHTTWERHVTAQGGDASWAPDVRLGGRKHISEQHRDDDAYYTIETAFSLKSLGIDYPAVSRFRFNLGRADKVNKQNSHWSGLGSFHQYRDYPWLMLGDKAIGGTIGEKLERTSGGFGIDYEIKATPAVPELRAFVEIRSSAESIAVSSARVGGGQGRLLVKTGKSSFSYSTGLHDGQRVMYRSRPNAYGRGAATGRAKLYAASAKALTITLNGDPIEAPTSGRVYTLGLTDGANRLEVKAAGPLELRLPWVDEPGTWKVKGSDNSVRGEGQMAFDRYPVTLSRTILHRHSRTFPYIDDADPLQASLGTPQPFSVIVNGLEGRTLTGYTLHVRVPEALEFVGASGAGKARFGRASCTVDQVGEITRDGIRYVQYRIAHDGNNKQKPGAMLHVAKKRLSVVNNTVTLVLRPRTGLAEPGRMYRCAYYAAAEDGAVVETKWTLPVKVLPPLSGRGPKKLISMTWFSYRSMDDQELRKTIYASHAHAGFNIFQGGRGDGPLLKDIGMKYEIRFNMTGDCMRPKETQARFPSIKAIDAQGRTRGFFIPFSQISTDPDVRSSFQEDVENYIRTYRPDVLHWDYEFDPLTGLYTSYDNYTLNEFRHRFAIVGELNAAIIAEQYREQWIAYMTELTGDVFKAVHEVTRKLGVEWSLYSGYPGDYTRDHYGVDYDLVLPHVDYAMMGYGRPLDNMTKALKLSAKYGNKPVVFGICATPYFLHHIAPQKNITPALIARRLVDGGYGVMYWGHYASDGRLLLAFNEINRMLHDYEDFIVDGRKVDPPVTIKSGCARDDLAAYQFGDRLLLFVLNNYDDAISVALAPKDGTYAQAREFYTGRTFDPLREMSLRIPAGGLAVVQFDSVP
ncbi:MAG: hypothetical protein KAI66_08615 [Lentisphaeria bacterium]|nr:hypothetical protein [Lentisphaeria bacterium]